MYCALDPALPVGNPKGGRCYGRRELVEYGTIGGAEGNVTHADSCSGCTFGDIYNTWDSDGTLFSVMGNIDSIAVGLVDEESLAVQLRCTAALPRP